jgi:hypothetical protein
MSRPTDTLRDMLIEVAPPALREAGRAMVPPSGRCTPAPTTAWSTPRRSPTGATSAATSWRPVGRGRATQREDPGRRLRTPAWSASSPAASASGWCSTCCSPRAPTSCCSTSPTTTSTSRPGLWLEEQIRQCKSDDPDGEPRPHAAGARGDQDHRHRRLGLLGARRLVRHVPRGAPKRQELLGDDLKRWNDEERRLFQHMKIMKQRAAQNFKNATKANAAETRWEKFVAAGPPPPPVPDQQIYVNLRGADAPAASCRCSTSRSVTCSCRSVRRGPLRRTGRPDRPQRHRQEPPAVGARRHHHPLHGTIGFGPRTSVGTFTQINDRPDFLGRECFEIVRDRVFDDEKSMKALARYGLRANAARSSRRSRAARRRGWRSCASSSRATTCCCSTSPPTTSTSSRRRRSKRRSTASRARCIAVSHDRTFLSRLDRFVMITDDGEVYDAARLRAGDGRRSRHPIDVAEAAPRQEPHLSRAQARRLSAPLV